MPTAKKPIAKKPPAKKVAAKKRPARAKDTGFSAEERAAMRERAKELKAEAARGKAKADGEADVQAQLARLPKGDRAVATKLHELIKKTTPDLVPRTWYGMPAYAKDGKVLCFFQPASKFGARYGTLGFSDVANLDDGKMWASSFALTELTQTEEKKIVALLKRAVR